LRSIVYVAIWYSYLKKSETVAATYGWCLGADGRPPFYDLLHRRSPQYSYAFDLLWL